MQPQINALSQKKNTSKGGVLDAGGVLDGPWQGVLGRLSESAKIQAQTIDFLVKQGSLNKWTTCVSVGHVGTVFVTAQQISEISAEITQNYVG